jgi:hypothetical protein
MAQVVSSGAMLNAIMSQPHPVIKYISIDTGHSQHPLRIPAESIQQAAHTIVVIKGNAILWDLTHVQVSPRDAAVAEQSTSSSNSNTTVVAYNVWGLKGQQGMAAMTELLWVYNGGFVSRCTVRTLAESGERQSLREGS